MSLFFRKNINALRVFFVFSFLFLSYFFFQFTIDDSYITFRYSKNFFNLGVWNWNPDQNFIECYTSTTYALLSFISHYLNIEPHIFVKFVGLLIGFLIFKRIISLKLFYLNEISIFIIVFFNPFFYFHLFSGLETPLFIFLILEGLIFLHNRNYSSKIFYLILLLLPATRPEGIIFSVLFLFYYFNQNKKLENKSFLYFIILIGIFYFVLRYNYYGKLLPNTFYHKSIDGFSIYNFFDIYNFKRSIIYLIIIISIIPFISNSKIKIYQILIPFVLVYFFYLNSRLSMNYAERFFIQIFLPLMIFLYIHINKKQAYFVLIISLLFSTSVVKNYDEILHLATYKSRLYYSYEKLGKTLNKYKDNNISIAMTDVGILPYYSEIYTIDLVGICRDTELEFDLKYLNLQQPKLLVFLATGPNLKDIDENYKWQKKILEYKNLENNEFVHAGSIKFSFDRYLAIFIDKKTTSFDQIILEIKNIEKNNNRKISLKNYLKFKYL